MNLKSWTSSRSSGLLWVGGLAIVLLIVASLASLHDFGSGSPAERARLAYERGEWGRVIELADREMAKVPDNPEIRRLKARGLARIGKGGEARALDASLGAERLEAEDLFLVGRGLIEEGRSDLGWAALDAASKLDPKHRETLAAIAAREERSKSADVSGAIMTRLAAVSAPPAMAELVVGLSATANGPGTPGVVDAVLDQFLKRHRPALLRLDTPSAARKLMARYLLEGGHAAEARSWLGRVAGAATDPESNWLLSRALLVEGRGGEAVAALGRAGGFGKDTPLAPEPSRYVGAKRCAECHEAIYKVQQESRHATTLLWGEGLQSARLPEGTVVDPGEPKTSHRFSRSEGELRINTEIDGQTSRALVEYVLGSGHHGSTMIARDQSGRHRSLRVSYYGGGDFWAKTLESLPDPVKPEEYLGDLLNEENFRSCVGCHATRFDSEKDRKGPEAADRGVGCERCHGPGDHHIRAVGAGFPELAIARPRLARPADRMSICAECHVANGEVPPSSPQFVRFQSTTLPFSRCVTESGGRLDCVTCHDPHGNVETSPAYYEARCLSCHGDGKSVVPSVERVAASRCPVNAAKGCIDCHMPKSEEVAPSTRFTDHHIRRNRPQDERASP